jgi:hypothetical protein
MAQSYKQLADQALDFWLARGAVLVIVVLQIAIVNDLTIGPRWLAPTIELALLIPLSIATAWTQRRARKASTDEQWTFVGRQRLVVRRLAISLTAVVTLMNFGALARLVEAILAGHAGTGRTFDQCHHLCTVVLGAGSRRPCLKRIPARCSQRFSVHAATTGRRVMPSPRLVAWLYRLSVSGLYQRNGIFAG